ncbi:MAG TPA: STAS domain-containing protein [Acidimicrobiia bacterium]|nr:STAS domain-containing protein [Acidimicrobiia bacterium]
MSTQTVFPPEFAPHPPPFAVESQLDGDLLTIAIVGELDIATVGVLEGVLRDLQGRYRTLHYDLADLVFMDTAGLRALVAPAGHDPPVSGISVLDPAPCVRRLLQLGGMQGLVPA